MQFSADTGQGTSQYDLDRQEWINDMTEVYESRGLSAREAEDKAWDAWYAEHVGD
jgi:hypothetical protein